MGTQRAEKEELMSAVHPRAALGVAPPDLTNDDLYRELENLYETRIDTLRHGSEDALATHTRRTAELEREYLRRYPEREVDPGRLRDGARERG
jgi:hypothetical protein